MILLSDNTWGDFPTWVQAGCAMITLMLVIMGLLQNKRIQELVDIVKELSNQTAELKAQTAVLANRYELEKRLSIRKVMPFFERKSFSRFAGNACLLTLVNTGQTASDPVEIRLSEQDNGIKYSVETIGKIDKKGEQQILRIIGTIEQDLVQELELVAFNFSFTLSYLDQTGGKISQFINCLQGQIQIEPPATM